MTELPIEIREFLQSGLGVVYSMNFVLAIVAYFRAKEKNLPKSFWAIKTFLLGGIALYEVTQAKDPLKMNEKPMESKKARKKRERDSFNNILN